MKYFALVLGTWFFCHPALAETRGNPQNVVFTYMGDPSTTLTVNWQTLAPQKSPSVVAYDTKSRDGLPESYQNKAEGIVFPIPGIQGRWNHQVTLKNLSPDTIYHLVAGSSESGYSQEISVKTIANDNSSVRLVTGGDMGPSADTRKLLKQAALRSPAVAVIGGDIAYANGKLSNAKVWDEWLKIYTEEMVTPEGLSIPMVLAIGNHEVDGGYGKTPGEAPFYFHLFGQEPGKSYFSRQFGRNLAVVVLDTGHVASHESQVAWLDAELKKFRDIRYKAAVYHVPLYPSHRSFDGIHSQTGRKYWLPVFDQHGLTVAFENHDHTFKRTHLLKNNQVAADGEGTLYLGDGCWGRSPRAIRRKAPWYLARSASERHFWVADFGPNGATYRAVNSDGQVFDIFPAIEPEAAAAEKVMQQIPNVYFLPDGAVTTSGLVVTGTTWNGGKTSIVFHNPFDRPAAFQAKPANPKGPIQAKSWGEESFTLQPDETSERQVEFVSSEHSPLPIEGQNLQLDVRIEVPSATKGAPPEVYHYPVSIPFHP